MSELSVQLYTLRKPLEQDFDGTLQKLAGFGFTQVEPFQLPAFADQLRSGLRKNGLAAPTTHVGLLSGNQDEICELAVELGIQTIIEPYVDPARWQAEADITQIATELNEAARTGTVSRSATTTIISSWNPRSAAFMPLRYLRIGWRRRWFWRWIPTGLMPGVLMCRLCSNGWVIASLLCT
jgi:hypothetical protein